MEKEAFERELLALTDTLYRVSASILPRQCDREDAIQESILTALQKRERLRDDGALRAWVVRILVNNCYDILRSQKRETSLPPDQAEIMRWDASPDAEADTFWAFSSAACCLDAYRASMSVTANSESQWSQTSRAFAPS